VRFSIQLLRALEKLYPDTLKIEGAAPMIGNPEVIQSIRQGVAVEKIIASWSTDRLDFNNLRIEYLLY
jgi:uncharacterized protein YbbC (DUF1343 family)